MLTSSPYAMQLEDLVGLFRGKGIEALFQRMIA